MAVDREATKVHKRLSAENRARARKKYVAVFLNPTSTVVERNDAIESLKLLDNGDQSLQPFYELVDALQTTTDSSRIEEKLHLFDDLLGVPSFTRAYADVVLTCAERHRNKWLGGWALLKSVDSGDVALLKRLLTEENFSRVLYMGHMKHFILGIVTTFSDSDDVWRTFLETNPDMTPTVKLFLSEEMLQILESDEMDRPLITMFQQLLDITKELSDRRVQLETFQNVTHLVVSSVKMGSEMLDVLAIWMQHFEHEAPATLTRSLFQKIRRAIRSNGFKHQLTKDGVTEFPEEQFHRRFGHFLVVTSHARLFWLTLKTVPAFETFWRIRDQLLELLRNPDIETTYSKLATFLQLLREHPPELDEPVKALFAETPIQMAFFNLVSRKIPQMKRKDDQSVCGLNNAIITPCFIAFYAEKLAADVVEKLVKQLWSQTSLRQLEMNVMTLYMMFNEVVGRKKRSRIAKSYQDWFYNKKEPLLKELDEKAMADVETDYTMTMECVDGMLNTVDYLILEIWRNCGSPPLAKPSKRKLRFLPGELSLAKRQCLSG